MSSCQLRGLPGTGKAQGLHPLTRLRMWAHNLTAMFQAHLCPPTDSRTDSLPQARRHASIDYNSLDRQVARSAASRTWLAIEGDGARGRSCLLCSLLVCDMQFWPIEHAKLRWLEMQHWADGEEETAHTVCNLTRKETLSLRSTGRGRGCNELKLPDLAHCLSAVNWPENHHCSRTNQGVP